MSTLGVLGGMGVQTTARFYTMLTDLQAVATEQEYIDILIYSKPSIPDRTAFITGLSDVNPLGAMLEAAKTLESAGVSSIAMPCVTAHYFYEKLVEAVQVPFINVMEETARYVKERKYLKVGLLATDGTLHGRLFQEAFARVGVFVTLPSKKAQKKLMDAIYSIKRGQVPIDVMEFMSWSLYERGAQAIVLGCTELGLLPRYKGYVYIEAMEVLAQAALRGVLQAV